MTEAFKSITQIFFPGIGHHSRLLSIENISIFILWLFTLSSLLGIAFGQMDWFIPKTPVNLLLGFLLVLINLPFDKKYGKIVFVLFFLFGMGLEIAGVVRGDVFGKYYYGENLGFKFYGVPLMIGIYWAVLTTVTSQIARMVFDKLLFVAILGAALMVGLDFLMEQLAHTFDFWHFNNGIAPFQNYLSWFLASFVLQIAAFKFFPKGGGRFAGQLYLNQIVFFIMSYILIQL
jgi:putative membrane protein